MLAVRLTDTYDLQLYPNIHNKYFVILENNKIARMKGSAKRGALNNSYQSEQYQTSKEKPLKFKALQLYMHPFVQYILTVFSYPF